MVNKSPKITIVLPVYGTGKYLAKCLDSVMAQTYENIEIICVNDASPDNSATILEEYKKIDKRILIVENEKNQGLFKSRLVGADISSGEYICFVDSDDSISPDWIRLLVEKTLEEKSDMTIGETIQVDKNGFFYNNNYMSMNFNKKCLVGEQVFSALMEDEGLNFAWHTVWNKLYSIKLWKKARKEFNDLEGHLIMAEDIAYSVVLYYYSQRMAFTDHVGYFYYRHDEASTSASISLERIRKNIYDIGRVFAFFENFLKKKDIYEKYELHFNNFKERNFRIYCNILYSRNLFNDKEFSKYLCDCFGQEKLELTRTEDFYFYEIRTNWDANAQKFLKAKEAIISKDYDIISFDLFDTLILRPFFDTKDLFRYIEAKYKRLFSTYGIVDFFEKRTEAERVARERGRLNTNGEDCNISEIYRTFSELYGIKPEISDELLRIEKETELSICYPRKSCLELYNLALQMGKKVIITTDTFYDQDFVIRILEKNGIKEYDSLFISCEDRCLKASATLFECIKSKYNTDPKRIIHFGDSWKNDILNAEACGLSSFFIPRTTEIFSSIHADNYCGDSLITNTLDVTSFANLKDINNELPISACLGIVANTIFERPYPAWNKELRYNANLYFIGYYVLGMEMLGIASWINKQSKNNNYKKIVFLARDGYLPKLAFDIVKKAMNNEIETEYFYVSRRAVLPLLILKRRSFSVVQDFLCISKHSPESIIQMFSSFITEQDKLKKELSQKGVYFELAFKTQVAFNIFAKVVEEYVDYALLEKEYYPVILKMKELFSKDVATFDLGYSGRIQAAICEIVEHPVDAFFIHTSGYKAESTAEEYGFKIHSFMDYTPRITSIIREYFFSELCHSCIGYKVENDKTIPLFDETSYGYVEQYLHGEMSRGMIDFISEYCKRFYSDNFMFEFKNGEISLPFEIFINEIPEKDMFCFRLSSTEDVCYFNYSSKGLIDTWKYLKKDKMLKKTPPEVIPQHHYENWADKITNTEQFLKLPRIKKAFILFFIDKKVFWKKTKAKFKKKKK